MRFSTLASVLIFSSLASQNSRRIPELGRAQKIVPIGVQVPLQFQVENSLPHLLHLAVCHLVHSFPTLKHHREQESRIRGKKYCQLSQVRIGYVIYMLCTVVPPLHVCML